MGDVGITISSAWPSQAEVKKIPFTASQRGMYHQYSSVTSPAFSSNALNALGAMLQLRSRRAPGPPRTVLDPIRGYPWLDPSRVRSAAVMVLGGPWWSWKVLDGPGKSERSFLEF